jgi:hypothetical protein
MHHKTRYVENAYYSRGLTLVFGKVVALVQEEEEEEEELSL